MSVDSPGATGERERHTQLGLNTITDFASSRRGKWVTLVAWLFLAGSVIPLAPTLQEISTNDTLQFLPGDAESTRAAELVRDRYPSDATPAIVVLRNEDGLTDDDFAAAEMASDAFVAMSEEPDSNVSSVVSISTVPAAAGELISPDGTTMTIVVNVTGSPAEEAYADRVEDIRDVTAQIDGAELQARVSGPGGLIADLISVFANIDGFLLIVTVSLVLVLLVLIYRSPVVALVPILIVGLVFQLSSGVGALILEAVDFPVSGQTTGIMTVILFGAGTDYILFISARYREELALHQDKHIAMRNSMQAVGGAITSASGTLVVASLILLFADLGSYRSLGPAIAIAILLMTVAALTLVPAVLAILGRFAFWPFSPRYDDSAVAEEVAGGSPIWGRIARFVLRRPGTVLATTTIILVLLSTGAFRAELTYDSLESLPTNVDSVEGFELLREGFPAGELAPTETYIVLPEGASALDAENLETIALITRDLDGLESVSATSSPAYPRGIRGGIGPDEVMEAIETIPPDLREAIATGEGGPPPEAGTDPALEEAIGIYVAALGFLSTDQEVSAVEVTLVANPYSTEAMDEIPAIRDTATAAATSRGLPSDSVLVGGETAENYDTRAANNRDTVVILPLVLLAIMIILGLLLRSVVAALYIGATIVVTYFATLGLATLFFVFVLGQDSLGQAVPFYLFVFLNALGVDYSIYLMSRVREEAKRYDLTTATERALTRTGGVITSAGLILAGTFGALMTLPLRDLFQLGFAVAIGVLMDTFITRSLLVPSLVDLLGKWNWWPTTVKRSSPEPTSERAPVSGE